MSVNWFLAESVTVALVCWISLEVRDLLVQSIVEFGHVVVLSPGDCHVTHKFDMLWNPKLGSTVIRGMVMDSTVQVVIGLADLASSGCRSLL